MICKYKINGSELQKLNDIALRFAGVENENEQNEIINAIAELLKNDNFDNQAANMKVTANEHTFCDPIMLEIMNEPVMVTLSGYTYERANIERYIQMYRKEPMTNQDVLMEHIVPNQAVKQMIGQWKQSIQQQSLYTN